MSKADRALASLWATGMTLEVVSEKLAKTPTSIASKLVRLGVFKDRASVNIENEKRGGNSIAALEHDGVYTIYVVRDPRTGEPIYVGQSQNFRKRKKSHMRRFSVLLEGRTPLIEKAETVATYALALEAERLLIAKFSDEGYALYNVLDNKNSVRLSRSADKACN